MAKMSDKSRENKKPPVPSDADLRGEIRAKAEEIYRKRGGNPGDELSDWIAAEKEIKKKYGIK